MYRRIAIYKRKHTFKSGNSNASAVLMFEKNPAAQITSKLLQRLNDN